MLLTGACMALPSTSLSNGVYGAILQETHTQSPSNKPSVDQSSLATVNAATLVILLLLPLLPNGEMHGYTLETRQLSGPYRVPSNYA